MLGRDSRLETSVSDAPLSGNWSRSQVVADNAVLRVCTASPNPDCKNPYVPDSKSRVNFIISPFILIRLPHGGPPHHEASVEFSGGAGPRVQQYKYGSFETSRPLAFLPSSMAHPPSNPLYKDGFTAWITDNHSHHIPHGPIDEDGLTIRTNVASSQVRRGITLPFGY
jgi:hypothetical protein